MLEDSTLLLTSQSHLIAFQVATLFLTQSLHLATRYHDTSPELVQSFNHEMIMKNTQQGLRSLAALGASHSRCETAPTSQSTGNTQ